MISNVRAATQQSIVVTTCREGSLPFVKQTLNDLLEELAWIQMPTFSQNRDSTEVKDIIDLFTAKVPPGQDEIVSHLHVNDWDGTIGSLVLGLGRKESDYFTLEHSDDPGAVILRAMKLLKLAGTADHTAQRIQGVCADVFDLKQFEQNGTAWSNSLSTLIARGFITHASVQTVGEASIEGHGTGSYEEDLYIIRKDSYFERVVTDYPHRDVPGQLEHDLELLGRSLVRRGDTVALYNLGVTYMEDKRLSKARDVYETLTHMAPGDFDTWYNFGEVLYRQKEFEQARDAFIAARNIRPDHGATMICLGLAYRELARRAQLERQEEFERWIDEAVLACEQATALDPSNALAWINLALAIEQRGYGYQHAREAFERAIEIEPENPEWHTLFALFLRTIGDNATAAREERQAKLLRQPPA